MCNNIWASLNAYILTWACPRRVRPIAANCVCGRRICGRPRVRSLQDRKYFSFRQRVHVASEYHQLVKWPPGTLPMGVKRPEHEAERLPISVSERAASVCSHSHGFACHGSFLCVRDFRCSSESEGDHIAASVSEMKRPILEPPCFWV